MVESTSRIITFYSFKGGVGRSMALANVAWLLAEKYGAKTIAVDWDLEAPGLHRFFGLKDAEIKTGLMDIIDGYKNKLREATDLNPESLIDLKGALIPIRTFSSGGTLSLVAAGCQDSKYAARINKFSWEDFYMNWHGSGFISQFKTQFKREAAITLIDSRTGVTDIGGICTLALPDLVVLLFALNHQNIAGIQSVAQAILGRTPDSKSGDGKERAVTPGVILRPARVERYAEEDKRIKYEELAAKSLQEFLPSFEGGPNRYIKKRSIPYVAAYSFGETPLAVVKNPDGELASSFRDLADSIMHTEREPEQGSGSTLGLLHGVLGRLVSWSGRKENRTAVLAMLFLAGLSLVFYLELRAADMAKGSLIQEQQATKKSLEQKIIDYEVLQKQNEGLTDPKLIDQYKQQNDALNQTLIKTNDQLNSSRQEALNLKNQVSTLQAGAAQSSKQLEFCQSQTKILQEKLKGNVPPSKQQQRSR